MDENLVRKSLKLFFKDFNLVSFNKLSEGAENLNFLIDLGERKVVIRVLGEEHTFMGKRTMGSILYEVEYMNFLSKKGLPVCFSYKSLKKNWLEEITINNDSKKIVILEYIEGEMPFNISTKQVQQVAKTMARMHNESENFQCSYKRKWPGTILDITDMRIKEFEKIDSIEINELPNRDLLLRFIKDYKKFKPKLNINKLRKGPIHGDIKVENMNFIGNKLVGLFDFDDCRETFFIEDITNTILFNINNESKSFLSKDEDRVSIFLKSYEKIRKLNKYEKGSLRFMFLARIIELILKDYIRYKKGKKFYMDFRIKDYFKYAEKYINIFDINKPL